MICSKCNNTRGAVAHFVKYAHSTGNYKKIVKLTKLSELNSFSNMVAQIDIDALKIYGHTKTNKLKIGKKD